MALYAKIPHDKDKIKRGISALGWQLAQDIPAKDRRIFEQTLQAYKDALEHPQKSMHKINLDL